MHLFQLRGVFRLIVLGMLLTATPAFALGSILLNTPTALPLPGRDLEFSVTAKNITGRKAATVYHRNMGATAYTALPMTEGKDDLFTAVLPAADIPEAGLEFYIEIRNDTGSIVTLPVKNPLGAPRRLERSTSTGEAVPVVFPDMNEARIESKRPAITAPLPPETLTPGPDTVRMALDDVDVTSLCVITATTVSYTPAVDLEYGSHHVIVEVLGPGGTPLPQRHWYFSIPQTSTLDRASASLQLDSDFGAKLLASKAHKADPDWLTQNSATLSTVLEKGKFRLSLDVNGWYAEDNAGQQEDPFSLNTYLLKLAYGEQSLSLGDIEMKLPELAGGELAKRGGLLDLNTDFTTLKAFIVRSTTTTDFDHASPVPDPDQRYMGVSLEQKLLPSHDVTLTATALSGHSTLEQDYNQNLLVPANEGSLVSLLLKGAFVDQILLGEAEYARSSFNQDNTDAIDAKNGQAWRARLFGRHDTLDYSTGFTSLGRNFQNVLMPTGLNNRREYTLYAAKTFEQSSLTFNGLHSFDNADRIDTMPTMTNTVLDLGYTLNRPDWPFLFANVDLNWQESGADPNGFEHIENQARIVALGMSLARETWSVVPSYVLTSFDDRSVANADSMTHQLMLSLGWQPVPVLSVNPSVTYARTRTSQDNLVTEDWLGTLSTTWLVTDTQNLNLTFSALDTRTNDDSLHTSTLSATTQYNWVLGMPLLESVTKTLSLRGTYANTKDHIAHDTIEDYVAYVGFNLNIPVNWP